MSDRAFWSWLLLMLACATFFAYLVVEGLLDGFPVKL